MIGQRLVFKKPYLALNRRTLPSLTVRRMHAAGHGAQDHPTKKPTPTKDSKVPESKASIFEKEKKLKLWLEKI